MTAPRSYYNEFNPNVATGAPAWVIRRKLSTRRPSKDAREFLRILDTIYDVAPNIFHDCVRGCYWHERLGLAYIWHDFLMDSEWAIEDCAREAKRFRAILRRIGPRTFYGTIRDIHIDYDDFDALDSWKKHVKLARRVDKEEGLQSRVMASIRSTTERNV